MSGSCRSCAGPVPGGSRFCPSCGAAVPPPSDVPTRLAPGPPARTSSPPSPSGGSRSPGGGIRSAAAYSGPASGSSSDPHGQARFIPGAMVSQRYRIIGLLGRGGMGEVYRADDLKLGQAVALKFLPEALATNQDRLRRFYDEVRISRQVTHSNVCRVYDIDEFEGQPFLSMEYIDGEDLSSLLKRIGRLPREKATQLARQICAGLSAAHDKGILHRDLKPANILVDGRGHAHITDFGLAGVAHDLAGDEVRAGTPAYMAPEQLAGREVTPKSDLYSLGLTLYELFTGKAAFEASTPQELMKLQTDTTPTSPTSFIEGFDPAVERVILRCLDKDPARRPGSALAVSAALPGGDPLAAALAAGETPSPEMVADAGEEGALRPATALGLLGVVVAGLVLQLFFTRGDHIIHRIATPKSPQVLEADAKRIVQALGYETEAEDSAYGFAASSSTIDEIGDNDPGPRRWDRLGKIRPSPLLFWYRQSPRKLVPANFRGNVSSSDPPADISGMITVRLDLEGRLTYFKTVPPQIEEDPDDGETSGGGEGADGSSRAGGEAPEKASDWRPLFAAASLEMAAFEPVEPRWNPDMACRTRSAWKGAYPDQPDEEIRIEACGYGGKPAWFFVIPPWVRPSRMADAGNEDTLAERALVYIILGFLLLLLCAAAFIAWRSLRLGRGDRRGGFRLAFYVFILMAGSDLFRRHHVASLAEIGILADVLAVNLLITALVWLLYQGLEPYVRRVWPELLISWSRLLSGRLRDPRIGRDILVGGTAFAVSVVLDQVSRAAVSWLGYPELVLLPVQSWPLVGAGGALSTWLLTIVNPLIGPLFVTFALLLLRLLLKRTWLAMTVMGVFFGTLVALQASAEIPAGTPSPALYAAIRTVSSVLGLMIVFTVVTRFGYLAFVFTSFFATPGNFFPITSDLSQWYAGPALLVQLPLLAVAFYGFHLAKAGRPVFQDALAAD